MSDKKPEIFVAVAVTRQGMRVWEGEDRSIEALIKKADKCAPHTYRVTIRGEYMSAFPEDRLKGTGRMVAMRYRKTFGPKVYSGWVRYPHLG